MIRKIFFKHSLLLSIALIVSSAAAAHASTLTLPSSMTPPDFAVEFDGEYCPYRIMSAFVMPGELMSLSAIPTRDESEFLGEVDGGELLRMGATSWQWLAPLKPGQYRITVQDFSTGGTICINAFVMTPYTGAPVLNGYEIGKYEREPLNDDPAYTMPWGFVEVTPDNADIWVSPHFQLKQFLCKQESEYPKYLVLKTRILLKLEAILDDYAQIHGEYPAVSVMSAYRTPSYNRKIGNRTSYSRHLYGDAVDIYIDEDGDENMDDLNGDGVITTSDAGVFYRRLDALYEEPWYTPFIGGLGLYGPKNDHGPFVHVDSRGSHARWGDRRGSRWLKANRLLVEDQNGATIRPERSAVNRTPSRFVRSESERR